MSIEDYLKDIKKAVFKAEGPELVYMNGVQLIKYLKELKKEFDWVDPKQAYVITKDEIRIMTDEDMI